MPWDEDTPENNMVEQVVYLGSRSGFRPGQCILTGRVQEADGGSWSEAAVEKQGEDSPTDQVLLTRVLWCL